MENFLLIVVLGILLIYFFSSSGVYKSLYKKVKEEKEILEDEVSKQKAIIKKYEGQVKASGQVLKTNNDNLIVAREDLQKLKLENIELKHQLEDANKRNEELYEQVNTMV